LVSLELEEAAGMGYFLSLFKRAEWLIKHIGLGHL
jgi:hypothetical protein